MLAIFFGFISLLYATVGQAGGTAFLALMAFATFPPSEMRPTALTLNIVAAAYSTWVFSHNKVVDWQKLRLLLASSLPTALIGGFIILDERIYKSSTGVVLLLAGIAMSTGRHRVALSDTDAPLWGTIAIGATVGLVSGLTGVGGGVFLAPTLIGLGWATPRQAAAMSPPFILTNSVVGLIGAFFAGQFPNPHAGLYAAAALAGSILGTLIGIRWLGQTTTKFILAGILLAAGVQLIFF